LHVSRRARKHGDLHSFPTRRSSDLPGRFSLSSGLEPGGSVPSSRSTWNCSGVRRSRHSFLLSFKGSMSLSIVEVEVSWSAPAERSEEHTSELQSRENLVCRLLLEKK